MTSTYPRFNGINSCFRAVTPVIFNTESVTDATAAISQEDTWKPLEATGSHWNI